MNVQLSQDSILSRDSLPIRMDLRARRGDPPRLALIVCHGFKGFKDWGFFPYACEQLAEPGVAVLSFNFSMNGIGEDPVEFTRLDLFERNTYSTELDDLDRVIRWFRHESPLSEHLADAPLALLGHSRGSIPAVVRAAEDPSVQAVVTWNGVGHPLRYSEEVLAQWEEDGKLEFTNARTGQRMAVGWEFVVDAKKNSGRFDLTSIARTMRARHLIVHGTADMAVPSSEANVLLADREDDRARLVEIEGGNHTFGAVHPFEGTTAKLEEALQVTRDWLRATIA